LSNAHVRTPYFGYLQPPDARQQCGRATQDEGHGRGDGRDELYGGPGYDVCYIDEGDFTRGCDEVALVIQ
jgi:hypothetical protein